MNIAKDTLDAQVPNLILQPLVENAIRHGIEPCSKPGRIELNAHCTADRLTLEVADNGAGLRDQGMTEEGVGLSNTRARLRHLYGEAHRFELRQGPEGGLAVQLIIPLRMGNPAHENSNLDRG
jgi:sensor histidine kinase YesM